MNRCKVSCVHGVANDWFSRWFSDFETGIPYADTSPVNWPSTGSFLLDSAQFFREEHRERWIRTVLSQIREQAPDVVVAHSMGSVLAIEALAQLTERPRLVLIGSPFHHHVLGPALELKARSLVNCESFWHDRDPIARHGRRTHFTSTQIWVSGSGDQHRAELYLDHPLVQAAIKDES